MGLAAVGAVCLVGAVGIGSAEAKPWIAVPDLVTVGFNPCTGQDVSLLLHDVTLLVSGAGGEHEGFKFKGRFATGDGYVGSFHDQDQWNAAPRPNDEVFTRIVLFRGANDTKQRIVFTTVVHVVVRDGVPAVEFLVGDGRCVGRRPPAG